MPQGVATFSELGLTRRVLRKLLAGGELERIGYDAYATPGAADVYRKAAIAHATVSCVTALRHRGIDVPGDSAVIHLSVPRRRGTTRSRWVRGTRRHFEDVQPLRAASIASSEEVEDPADTGAADRLASPLDAYARAATCLGYLDAVALLDLVEQERRAGQAVPELAEILAQVRRTSPTLARHLAVDVDTKARSFRESAPRVLLRAAGLAVVAGARIPGVGEVDLLVAGCIVIEIDGKQYHSERRQFRQDRRRDRRLAHLGFLVLRYAWEDAAPLDGLRDVLDLLECRSAPAPFSRTVPEQDRDAVTRLRAAACDSEHTGASPTACAALETDLAAAGVDRRMRTEPR